MIRPILLVGGFLAWGWISIEPLSPAVAMAANLAGSLLALTVALIGLRRVLPAEARTAKPESEFSLWISTTAGLFAVSLGQLVIAGQIDIVVVGSLLGSAASGLYTLAILLISPAWIGIGAILYIATPMIADFHRNRPREDLQNLLSKVSLVGFLVSFPIIVILALSGKLVISIFFGPDFVGAYPILLVTLVTTLQGVVAGALPGYVMSMTGHQKSAAWMVAIAAVVYLVLVAPMTGAWGAVGTAAATSVAFLVRNILLVWFIRTRLKLNVLPIPWPVRTS